MSQKTEMKTNVTIKDLDNSEIQIEGEINAEIFDAQRPKAIKHLGSHVDIPGFRKGHVPENMLVSHIGERAILEEMAELAIAAEYPNIVSENKLEPIGRPEVGITKIAMGNPLGFTIKVAVMPDITLADYKKIAAKEQKTEEKIEVSEEEVADTLKEIQKMHASQNPAPAAENDTDTEAASEEAAQQKEPELPEIDDEFVKKLGDFKNVDDFKAKLKDNITFEKKRKAQEKKRLEIMDAIIAESSIDLPNVIIEAELDKLLHQFKMDVESMGMQYDDYLKQSGKKEEEIRKDLRKDAEKRAKLQLILNKIAVAENITAPEAEVKAQVEQLTKQYADADPERAQIYVETTITNQKVFEFLENQK